MKKILVSLLLLTTMLMGCGKQEKSVIDSNAFNLDNNTASTQQEQSTEVEDDTKATATSLISKFMEDAKKGFTSDIVIEEQVGVDVDSVKGKTYNTLLDIKEKGTFRLKDTTTSFDGYLAHTYTYNTNYADIIEFINNDNAEDAKSLIDKKAKEYTQNLLTVKNLYAVDDNCYKIDKRHYSINNLIISDFSNLTFKETEKGYTVTATISDKMFGNLFNLEDIYLGTNCDTKNCTYNVVFYFDKEKNLTDMDFELAKGVGSYNGKLNRVSDIYMKSLNVTLNNMVFDSVVFPESPKQTINSREEFLRVVNKY